MKFSKNEIIAFDFLYILCDPKGTAIGSNGKKTFSIHAIIKYKLFILFAV